MTGEVLLLIRRVALGTLVLVGAAVGTFELTASAAPAPPTPCTDAPSTLPPPALFSEPAGVRSAHALAPPAFEWCPPVRHL